MRFVFGEANEEQKRDFEKWVLSLNEGTEMGNFELANLMMEFECEGGDEEKFMTMVSEK